MQKINNFSKDKLVKKENNQKDESIKELVDGFSKEKYNIEKTNQERKTFKKQLIIFIIVIIIAIGTIIGASFTIYYAYKHNIDKSQGQQKFYSLVLDLSKNKKIQ